MIQIKKHSQCAYLKYQIPIKRENLFIHISYFQQSFSSKKATQMWLSILNLDFKTTPKYLSNTNLHLLQSKKKKTKKTSTTFLSKPPYQTQYLTSRFKYSIVNCISLPKNSVLLITRLIK